MTLLRLPLSYCQAQRLFSKSITMRKAPGVGGKGEKSLNQDFVDFLFELSNYEKNVNRNTFKSNAYKKAAGVLSKLDYRISSGEEARKLDGIGDRISKKIDEFLQTGKLDKLEKIRSDDTNTALNLLTRVAGIGPAKARSLVDSGICTIEQLRDPINEHLLTHGQKVGLNHFEDFEKRIPRPEIKKVEKVIQMQLKKLKVNYEKCNNQSFIATICGSYRRGLATSGDIDVLLTHPNHTSDSLKANPGCGSDMLKAVVNSLRDEADLITDTLSLGGTKFMGVCRMPGDNDLPFRRLDIRLLPYDQYYCGILYFTGSDQFNKAMRSHALDQGFTLNEYSLRPLDKGRQPLEELPVICEEDIFDYISFEWREPEDRSW